MVETADVIVVGLGAAGAAAAWRLARKGLSVIGFDRHHPPHDRGSSHGGSRITRQAIGEGDDYVPLALRSHELWREIEAETGESLLLTTGAVVIGDPAEGAAHPGKEDFLLRTIAAARRFGIPHEVLTPAETTRRYPQLTPRGDETVYFEPGAGLLFPERCVAAQIGLARRAGARIRLGEAVLTISDTASGVRVVTDQGDYEADQVVVAAGAWAGGLLGGPTAAKLSTWRQQMHWFAPDDPAAFAPERFPVFIWMHGAATDDWFYGFTLLPGEPGVKVADERFDAPLTGPVAHTLDVDPAAPLAMWTRHVPGRVAGVTDRPVKSAACLYTMAPGSRFRIGREPGRERVIVASACSGHGFKHSAAVGDLVAELATARETPDLLAPFALL